jgi:hypothetical protein
MKARDLPRRQARRRGAPGNATEDATDAAVAAPPAEAAVEPAAPAMDFEILIPIWGDRYIRRFAELGLRSLLAPRNLPWLCRHHRVRVRVMTTQDGVSQCRLWPAFVELIQIAEVSYIAIDDLVAIYGPNYSVILTRAFNRAMAFSPELVGRNFIYLVGDQVFANGALETIARAMEAGHDACLACTPRVEIDLVEGMLADIGTPVELALSNRDMVDLLLNFPHPTLVAKTVQDEAIHLSAAHQFFWRPDADTFVARCFLLHMLCIRPTRRPRDIAGPCDFSFVSELAPGGDYHYLVDSDTFLALELQEAVHEAQLITPFNIAPAEVAESVSAWATAIHHENIKATFVFRGGTGRYLAGSAANLTQSYVDTLLDHVLPPRDHRHHPFWVGAVGATVLTTAAHHDFDGANIPRVLRRLITGHMSALAPLDLAVAVANGPSALDAILASGARVGARISAEYLYAQIEDVAGPGGRMVLVQLGDLWDFGELFSNRGRVSRLLRVAGEGRVLLLCYQAGEELRNSGTTRLDLYQTFAARLPMFGRLGLAARVHDLADRPLDGSLGFVVEVVADDKGVRAPAPSGRFDNREDDLLYGLREPPGFSIDALVQPG